MSYKPQTTDEQRSAHCNAVTPSIFRAHEIVSDLSRCERELDIVRQLLLEVWMTIPATYDPNDEAVKSHAHALNQVGAYVRSMGVPPRSNNKEQR